MKKAHYAVVFEKAENNWAAYVPDLPGCMSDGDTPEEAIEHGKDALRSFLLTLREFGDAIPAPGSRITTAVPASIHSRLAAEAEKDHVGVEDLAADLLQEGLEARNRAA